MGTVVVASVSVSVSVVVSVGLLAPGRWGDTCDIGGQTRMYDNTEMGVYQAKGLK